MAHISITYFVVVLTNAPKKILTNLGFMIIDYAMLQDF